MSIRPPYAANARLAHTADWPATQRCRIPGGHGLNTEVTLSAACRRGGKAHASCFKINCPCGCHNYLTGGVKPGE